mmetsp:Transcript_35/g.120  ORF Transcript_35/g.120 Transcript_35/m.120 type:complete len:137 (+) Transcript_35:50-460(+)
MHRAVRVIALLLALPALASALVGRAPSALTRARAARSLSRPSVHMSLSPETEEEAKADVPPEAGEAEQEIVPPMQAGGAGWVDPARGGQVGSSGAFQLSWWAWCILAYPTVLFLNDFFHFLPDKNAVQIVKEVLGA